MKALVIDDFSSADHLKMVELPTPIPAENEVLIKIVYTAVNPVDWKICEGMLKERLPHKFPLIPGWDAAGTIAAVGAKVTQFSVGDKVYAYCRKPEVQWGTYAEYIAVDAASVALKPKNLNYSAAAAIPLVGLTAWQALFDVGHLKAGQSVLIHAGAGGVGGMAIQFAKNAGAKVYTTASQKNHDYTKQLGAARSIDYTKDNFISHIKVFEPKGVDLVFDTIGGAVLQDSAKVVKKGGRLVSIVEKPDPSLAEKQIEGNYVFVRPNGEQLGQIGALIESSKVIAPHLEEMQLEDAAYALQRVKKGHTMGKIVLKVV